MRLILKHLSGSRMVTSIVKSLSEKYLKLNTLEKDHNWAFLACGLGFCSGEILIKLKCFFFFSFRQVHFFTHSGEEDQHSSSTWTLLPALSLLRMWAAPRKKMPGSSYQTPCSLRPWAWQNRRRGTQRGQLIYYADAAVMGMWIPVKWADNWAHRCKIGYFVQNVTNVIFEKQR